MSAYLITGRAGSGKSAVASELKERGLLAYDTDDIEGLSSWQIIATGELVRLSDATNVDLSKYWWIWKPVILTRLIKSAPKDIFICGGAANDFDFEALLTKHFVLDVSPEVQIERLRTRTNNDYAKDPIMYPMIVNSQANHIVKAASFKATVINANQLINSVVDDILRTIYKVGGQG